MIKLILFFKRVAILRLNPYLLWQIFCLLGPYQSKGKTRNLPSQPPLQPGSTHRNPTLLAWDARIFLEPGDRKRGVPRWCLWWMQFLEGSEAEVFEMTPKPCLFPEVSLCLPSGSTVMSPPGNSVVWLGIIPGDITFSPLRHFMSFLIAFHKSLFCLN